MKLWPFGFLFAILILFLSSCRTEILRQQEEQIRQQEEEISRQRREIEELKIAQQREEQKRQDCNRAFSYYEKAQGAKNPQEAALLYRQGLKFCPDDDVAHYELGKIFHTSGQLKEAEAEFEAALKINPNFTDAKRQLETIRKR
ncbi:MAG: tetratricopeptide repeat protein [Deltaproteobacteria bacterium]|nr:MAG: tetratricopeptide repeat protein [Deltaproteobacteria bacterium]